MALMAQAQENPTLCPIKFPSINLCASLDWVLPPQTHQEASILLKFWHKDNGSVNGPYQFSGEKLGVDLWMPAMNHGSAPTRLEVQEAGVFLVKNLYFIMPGHWQLRFKVIQQDKILDRAVVDLHL